MGLEDRFSVGDTISYNLIGRGFEKFLVQWVSSSERRRSEQDFTYVIKGRDEMLYSAVEVRLTRMILFEKKLKWK